MIACPRQPALAALLEGTLDGQEDGALRSHVDGCARCQTELERLTDSATLDPFRCAAPAHRPAPIAPPDLSRVLAAVLASVAAETTVPCLAAAPGASMPLLGPPSGPGEIGVLGVYRVEAELGRGGMGIVYRAFDPMLRRHVALKLLRPELADDRARRRLVREARAAARFRHDHVVTVYAVVDPPDGLPPYLVMEYLDGPRLSDLTRAPGGLAARAAAALVAQVADGLAAAHAEGLVHRDVKPANILIERATQRAKLTDFGLALAGDADGPTREGSLAGTPAYMSPEQVQAKAALDGRSDVYSLGATLYEALTGVPPFRGATHAVLRRIVDEEPVPPRRLDEAIPRDLETICLKALAKDPAHRFPTARALGDDLRRYLAGKPITARPVSAPERALKWARRRPDIVALLATIAGIAALGFALVLSQWQRAEARRRDAVEARGRERARADAEAQARRDAQRTSAALALAKAQALGEHGRRAEALLWLAEGLRLAPDDAPGLQRALRANWDHWRPELALTRSLQHEFSVEGLAFSPDGRLLVTTDVRAGKVRIWNVADGTLLHVLDHDPDEVAAVAFHPDGTLVATGAGYRGSTVRLWDAATGRSVRAPMYQAGPVSDIAFSPDGKQLAVAAAHRVRIWDVAKGQPLAPAWTSAGVHEVVYFPDNQSVLTAGYPWTSSRRDALTGAPIGAAPLHPGTVRCVSVSPDGKTYLTGCEDQRIRRVDATTGKVLWESPMLPGPILSLRFSPDGQRFASGTTDGVARVWDVATFHPVAATSPHLGDLGALAFAPDGKSFATGCGDKFARIWTLSPRASFGMPLGTPFGEPVRSLAISRDGRTVVCQAGGKYVDVRDTESGQPVGAPATGCSEFFPLARADGTYLVEPVPGEVRAWRPTAGAPSGPAIVHGRTDPGAHTAALSPDGRRLVVVASGWGNTARLLDTTTGESVGPSSLSHPDILRTVTFSADGKTLLTGGHGMFRLWDPETGEPRGEPIFQDARTVLVPSPDGRHVLAAGSWDDSLRIWPVQVWDLEHRTRVGMNLHFWGLALSAAFHPDGHSVVVGDIDRTARLWNAGTGAALGPPLPHDGAVVFVAFSPDGRTVLTRSLDGKARLWEPTSGKLIAPPLTHEGRLQTAAFLPGGRAVLTGGEDGRLRRWIVPEPVDGSSAEVLDKTVALTGMRLDPLGLAYPSPAPKAASNRAQPAAGSR